MRLLFTALGSAGHTYPLLPLAVAARDAGNDVVFATAEDFLPSIRNAGLSAAAAGLDIRQSFAAAAGNLMKRRKELTPEELGPIISKVFGEVMPSSYVADLPAVFAEHRPELVVYEYGNPGGGLAAWQAGIPAVAHSFGRLSATDPMAEMIRRSIHDFAAGLGHPRPGELAYGNRLIDICPDFAQTEEVLGSGQRDPLRPTGWNEPGDLPAGVADRDRGRPLVYLTLGTAMGDVAVLRAAIDGLSTLDVDVLVATGPSVELAALGDVPENVRLEAWVPQAELLGHVDLVVHHGGSGTTMGSFAAGLPQLLLPQGADQFSNAEVVTGLGAGSQLLDAEVTAESVRERAAALLTDDTVRAVTTKLAGEVAAMPSPAQVAARLPELVG